MQLVSGVGGKPPHVLPPASRTFNQSDSCFFGLPPELRNLIYEYAFSEVEDQVAIKLDGGYNAEHAILRQKTTKRRVILEDEEDEPSQLALLLTCKQINAEASAIAFSKMRFLATRLTRIPYSSPVVSLLFVEEWLADLQDTFGVNKLKLVKRLVLANETLLYNLPGLSRCKGNFVVDEYGFTAYPSCGATSTALQTLSHIEEIILHMDDAPHAPELVAGASWVSLALQPRDEQWLLAIMPLLKKIVARGQAGEQTSVIMDGHIVAAESGMRLGGCGDWK